MGTISDGHSLRIDIAHQKDGGLSRDLCGIMEYYRVNEPIEGYKTNQPGVY